MKILFYPYNYAPFRGNTLQEKSLEDGAIAIIQLAKALYHLGHEVYVITSLAPIPNSAPPYVTAEQAWQLGSFDLMIGGRSWEAFWQPFRAKKKLLWTGDSYVNSATLGLGDPRVHILFDTLLCVSEWQKETLCAASGYPRDRAALLAYGVQLEDFQGQEIRQRKRLICTSNLQHELLDLPRIYLPLKIKDPEIELHIYSDVFPSDLSLPSSSSHKAYFAILEMLNQMPSCSVHRAMSQQQLAREMMQSSLFLYFGNHLEASSLALMNAQAAGCPIVASSGGMLPEIVGTGGITIEERPRTDLFIDKYCEAIEKILADDLLFQTLSKNGLQRSKETDWQMRALQLIGV